MEMGRNLEHTTERLTEGLRCPWKLGLCGRIEEAYKMLKSLLRVYFSHLTDHYL